jgi:enamine deaminase RidA (YjgF/YER057c/UK114 family)
MPKKHVYSVSPYEKELGFCRAVRFGDFIQVAGTPPFNPDGTTACPGDIYGQAVRCLEIIQKAIEDAGGKLSDVVRTRMYLTDIMGWEAVGKAHGEFFRDINPASTMVEVKSLVRGDWLVEIEAECYLGD